MSNQSLLLVFGASLSFVVFGCGPSTPSNETCNPSPNAHTESCWIYDQEFITVRTAANLEKICNSSCSKISDLAVIGVDGAEDLGFLAGLERIKYLSINNNQSLSSLDGLDEVGSIGSVKIGGNPNLSDVSALGSVGELTISLTFRENSGLKDLAGLEDLETLGTEAGTNSSVLDIEGNDSLENLDGLSGLKTIANGETYIIRNPQLRRIGGLQDITEFPDGLTVTNNAKLEDITSLYGTETVGKSLRIQKNPKLPNCQAQRIADNAMVENSTRIGDNGSGECMEQ